MKIAADERHEFKFNLGEVDTLKIVILENHLISGEPLTKTAFTPQPAVVVKKSA